MERITHAAYRFYHREGALVGSKNHPSSLVGRSHPYFMNKLIDSLQYAPSFRGHLERATIRRVAGGRLLRSDLAVHATLAISRRDLAAIVKIERRIRPTGTGKLDTFCLPQRLHRTCMRCERRRWSAKTINQREK